MKSKFDFNEIVTVVPNMGKKSHLSDKRGYIVGKAENENHTWSYAVSLFDIENVWSFKEQELKSTGEFFKDSNQVKYGSIRVTVNDKGEGNIKQTFTSYKEIEEEIKKADTVKVSGHMIEVGMLSEDITSAYNLVNLCIQNSNTMIKSSGYNALWHLLLRFKDELPSEQLMKFIRLGLDEQDKVVSDVITFIMKDLKQINPATWYQIEKYKK